ncbi:MAG TPA: hypothetical protein VGV09_10450 [Steroidobacteraceae bacterium]|nr:hypothetical protein [Steroidobacteraceae bacterium]
MQLFPAGPDGCKFVASRHGYLTLRCTLLMSCSRPVVPLHYEGWLMASMMAGGGSHMRNLTAACAALAALCFFAGPAQGGEAKTIWLPEGQEVQLALQAGPEHLRANAAVYVFAKDGYRKARNGTNGFTCLVNRDGNQAGDNDLKPTCWDAEGSRTILPVVLRVGALLARSGTAEEIKRDIEAGFATGKFSSPQKSGIAYMLRGDVPFDPGTQRITHTTFMPHYMIYAPGVTNADIGMPPPGRGGTYSLPSVYSGYSGGTRTAYIIIVAAPRVDHAH